MELANRSQTMIQRVKQQGVKEQRHKEQGYRGHQRLGTVTSGHANTGENKNQTAIQHYEKALKIAKEERHKLWETIACAYREFGHAYTNNNQNETEIQEYMQTTKKEGYKLLETIAYFPEAASCLFLTSVCSKDCDYEKAKRLYEMVLNNNHNYLPDKTLGFGVVLFNLEDTEKTVKSVYEIKTSIANTDTTTGNYLKIINLISLFFESL